MRSIEALLKDVCHDQRESFRTFALTGDPAALARIHFEKCPACDYAVDALELVPETPKPSAPYDPADDPVLLANIIVGGILGMASLLTTLIGMTVFLKEDRGMGQLWGWAGFCLTCLIIGTMLRVDAGRTRRMMSKTAP